MNVLAVTFTYSGMSEQELRAASNELAPNFANIPGCFEKTWLLDAAASRCGGIYKFRDRAALETYLASDLWKGVESTPQFSAFDVRMFDVIEAPTAVTHGLPAAAAAR
jgi:hypothetical protein